LRFRAASDQALLVYLGDEISLATHQRVVGLLRLIQKERPRWMRNLQPAYSSLLVDFDPLQIDHDEVQNAVRDYARHGENLQPAPPRVVEIPVCYGNESGPDLDEVASLCKLTPQAVAELHASITYHAYFLGFAPGFAYLGDLPDGLACPRLASPRRSVPAGSVAIAGKQTAVYPFATPGGWRLIGRTPSNMFRADREPMGLIEIGDEVRFRAITPDEFAALESA
jgi:KipI family sensor histidine kinase inhibitor